MRAPYFIGMLTLAFGLSVFSIGAETDAQIKQTLIKESIASYSGSCPCPYNKDRAGKSCGKRSAYSRPGGKQPLCYESDVTAKMVADYKARQKK